MRVQMFTPAHCRKQQQIMNVEFPVFQYPSVCFQSCLSSTNQTLNMLHLTTYVGPAFFHPATYIDPEYFACPLQDGGPSDIRLQMLAIRGPCRLF